MKKILLVCLMATVVYFLYYQFGSSKSLTFSDSAKYAQAGLNLSQSGVAKVSHSFFGKFYLDEFNKYGFFHANFPVLNVPILAFVFEYFPANDIALISIGYIFYLLSIVLAYLIGKKLHSSTAGVISSVFLATFIPFIEYSFNFSSEVIFIFEILLFTYLAMFTGMIKFFSILALIPMYYSRQQAPVFYIGVLVTLFFYILTNIKDTKTKLKAIIVLGLCSFIVISTLLNYAPLKTPLLNTLYSLKISNSIPPGFYLRGIKSTGIQSVSLISKTFYNIYNFAKSPERIVTPIILGLFLLAILKKDQKNKSIVNFNNFVFIQLLFFILSASISLSNARYVHPIVPLLIISTSIYIAENLSFFASAVLVSFIILPTMGYLTLDYRFRRSQFNFGKPTITKVISDVMAENLPKDQLIITNLDAWAAWYHGLSTMWFPISPEFLSTETNDQNLPKYIFISSFKESDGDFVLNDWSTVVYGEDKLTNPFLKKNYKVEKIIKLDPDTNFERLTILGTILELK